MPLLSLPADVLLEILSYMETGSSLSAAGLESGTSTLAAVSLVCKQLRALARRPLLRSLRWCDKTKTNLNLNQWQRNSKYANSVHVPKKLVIAVDFDFDAQSLDARSFDIILHERIYTRISSFSSLSALVLSNTSISAQYLYPILLALPMLRSLALLNVKFARLTHDNETDETLSSVLNNYPFTSLHLTHIALRGITMSAEMENTYDYHPINFLRVPSLQNVEILWTPQVTAAYTRHVHSKIGIRRQSGQSGWPNTDIPCTVLENDQNANLAQDDTPPPLQRLMRLTVHVPLFDLDVVRALKAFLADCAQHPSYDPPVHPSMMLQPESSIFSSSSQNSLLITLFVENCRLSSDLDPEFQGCLSPVVRYEGPLWADILSLFMDPDYPLLSPTHSLTRVSSFHSPSPTEAEDREIQIPSFREVLYGFRALSSASPVARTRTTNPTDTVSDRRFAGGVKILETRVHALDCEILYAIQQFFGSCIEKIVIRYAYHNGKSANTLLERIPDILSGLPNLLSFILIRIPDPSVVFSRTALERHAAIVGDRQWFRWPGHHHHQPMMNPFNLNPAIPNHMNPNHFDANHPHWNPPQAHAPDHLLTVEQFKQHTATMERARRAAATSTVSPFRFNITRKPRGVDDRGDDCDGEDQEMRDHVSGWGRICGSLWEVQVENFRFVRRFGEIGDRWTRVPVLL